MWNYWKIIILQLFSSIFMIFTTGTVGQKRQQILGNQQICEIIER